MTMPPDKIRYKAVLFDLDGTLVDSVADLARASNRLLAELGRPPVELPAVRSFIGDGAPKLVERVLAATGGLPEPEEAAHCLARFLALYEAEPSAHSTLYPGVAATLARLSAAGIRLGLCTNKPMAPTRLLLNHLGIAGRFAATVAGDSLPSRKPSPEPVLDLLARLGIAPADAVFVGDNEHDVSAARAAGMARVFVVRHGYARIPLEELDHDGILERFEDLPAMLG